MRHISRQISYVALILALGAIAQGLLMVLLLRDAGVNDQILEVTARVRGGVQRYAKLVIAGEMEKAKALSSEIDRDFDLTLVANPRLSWYHRERREFLGEWEKLRPEWSALKEQVRNFQVRPTPGEIHMFVEQSERFLEGRVMVGEFVDDLRDKKHLLYASALIMAAIVLMGILVLVGINVRSVRGQLESRAMTDPLTGLLNREGFFGILSSNPKGNPGTILMADLDHFKGVNDRFGHQEGDALLVGLARTFSALLRKKDLLCRFGGEEFLIWLPDTPMADAQVIAHRLRETLAGFPFPVIGHATVSIGGAPWPAGTPWRDIYPMVDEALYQAKKEGRNRVVFKGN